MTEDQWLRGDSSGQMIEHVKRAARLPPHVRARKYRLAALAMARELLADDDRPDLLAIFDATERFCDGRCRLADVERVIASSGLCFLLHAAPDWGMVARGLGQTESLACLRVVAGVTQLGKGPTSALVPGTSRTTFVAVQCRVLRDVFGNPFRPASFSPEWRTDTAVSLARQMYDAREFSIMPILADALQDAGCDDEQVLAHCRDTSLTHVGGCWVCDLVLGRA
jgi:hypothetical protein